MTPNDDAISESMQASLDLAWSACDLDGHLAYFTSGGVAKLPRAVLRSDSARILGLDGLLRLPTMTRSIRREGIRQFKQVSKRYFRDFDSMAARGLFGYDSQLHHHPTERYVPYLLVVEPAIPAHLDSLEKEIRDVVASVHLPVRFRERPTLPPQLLD